MKQSLLSIMLICFLMACGMEPPRERSVVTAESQAATSKIQLRPSPYDLAFANHPLRMKLKWSNPLQRGSDSTLAFLFYQIQDQDLADPWSHPNFEIELVRAVSCCGKELPLGRTLHPDAQGWYQAGTIAVATAGYWTFTLVLKDSDAQIVDQLTFEVEVR